MAQAYKSNAHRICGQCETDIEVGDTFWKDGDAYICECCYEDNHEYDNE